MTSKLTGLKNHPKCLWVVYLHDFLCRMAPEVGFTFGSPQVKKMPFRRTYLQVLVVRVDILLNIPSDNRSAFKKTSPPPTVHQHSADGNVLGVLPEATIPHRTSRRAIARVTPASYAATLAPVIINAAGTNAKYELCKCWWHQNLGHHLTCIYKNNYAISACNSRCTRKASRLLLM